MKRKRLIGFIFLLSIWLIAFNSCSEYINDGQSKFSIWLIDTPGDFAEINIDVINVEVKIASGWRSLSIVNPGVYNLLDLTNGKYKLLASDELTEGNIPQIRLILGNSNSLKMKNNTTVYNLDVPSGQETGIKIDINAKILAGVAYNLYIDFDAAKSIVVKGKGKYALKPTIRSFTIATNGAIKGKIVPAEAHPNIQATMGNETFTTYPDSDGKFLLGGLNKGSYKVIFVPATGYQEVVWNNVVVTKGEVTDLQTITIQSNK